MIKHWTAKRKAVIAYAVLNDHMTFTEAMATYGLSPEELMAWLHGKLKATKKTA